MTILTLFAAAAFAAADTPSDRIAQDVSALAAPEMEGRGLGTDGIERAAAYIEGEFKKMRLKAPKGGYAQKFEVTVGEKLGEANFLRLGGVELKAQTDFIPLAFSESVGISGKIVFAGYGITDPTRSYDDFAGLDVSEKVAVVLRFEPQENDPKSVFDGTANTSHATLRAKVSNAKAHGASALVVVTGPANHAGEEDALLPLAGAAAEASAGIPCVHIALSALCRATGMKSEDLRGWQERRDADLGARLPAPFSGLEVSGTVHLVREKKITRNVIALLPGKTADAVVIGAHYDHLGRGGANSLDPDSKAIHPGADDNASGVAAMLETARTLSARGLPNRTHVFVAFTGEESGLLGSSYYVKHAPVSISRTALMMNFDMVGRLHDSTLHVMGADTGTGLKAIAEKAVTEAKLTGRYTAGGYGPSDHSSFYAAKVPVLFFFTGAHPDYHRPSDTADKINAAGEAQVVSAALSALAQVDASERGPAYVEVVGEAPSARDGAGGYGPYFGVIPEFGDEDKDGVRISGARPGSPSARAGLLAKDRIVSFGGQKIGNLYDLTYAMRSHRPGDKVAVEWIRGEVRMAGEAVLEKRGAQGAGNPHAAPVSPSSAVASAETGTLVLPGERHFAGLRQLTFGGENAEAYWSPDGTRLIFQSTREGYPCDQIYVMNADGSNPHRISTGTGRCTCGYFLTNDRVLFASTHESGPNCPPPPDRSHGYAWALYPAFEIYSAKADGTKLAKLAGSDGYDAEATVSPDGKRVVFTSTRSGDPELYLMSSDGSGVARLTHEEGYDGGAVFSPDGKKIVYRASRHKKGPDLDLFRSLMKQHVVRPSRLEIYTMDLASRRITQVTHNDAANFAPCWHPDGRRILYASNRNDPKGRNFDLVLIGEDRTGEEQITTCDEFDGFPLFSPDGKRLAFCSNRNGKIHGETNVFVADWKD